MKKEGKRNKGKNCSKIYYGGKCEMWKKKKIQQKTNILVENLMTNKI